MEEHGADADLVWVFGGKRVNAEALRLFPRCGAIIRSGSGTDNIPVAAATARGIIVANTPEAVADSVSNHAIGLLLAVTRRIAIQDRAVRQGRWDRQGDEHRWHLRGQTLGLVGFGHIGRLVARKLNAFDMKILAFDPLVSAEEIAEVSVEPASFEYVLSRSDFLSIHCPLTPKTRHLIGEPQFRLMKPEAVLINTSRGPVLDEKALVAALREGQIAAAGLDVTEQEPTPPDNPLLKLDNVVITPHIAGYTDQFAENFGVTRSKRYTRWRPAAGRRPMLTGTSSRVGRCMREETESMLPELEKARKLKERLKAGEVCFGAQLALSDPAVVEIFGNAGYDWLLIDTEHSATSLPQTRAMLQAGVGTGSVVLARPLIFDPDEIRRLLDNGSPGLVCPFINNGEKARRLVEACRYPPEGIRGYGPRRAGVYFHDADEYVRTANDALFISPIIESRDAIDNIDDIMSVDGINAAAVGPMDLSMSLGVFKQFDDPKYVAAVDKVREACHKHGKAMGGGCLSIEDAADCIAKGDQFLLVTGDDTALAAEARGVLESLKK